MNNTHYDFVTAKEEYRTFCENGAHDIQIFALPWYLDAVCDSPDDWQVIIYKENNKIVAAFPFQYTKTKRGAWEIKNPWQAPRLGIWMDYGNRESNSKRETFENTVTQYVIENLPYFDTFSISFDARYKNWRKFFEADFSQETRYSYLIPASKTDDNLLETFSKHRKKAVVSAEKETIVEISDDYCKYCEFFKETYRLRKRKASYSIDKLSALLRNVIEKEYGEIYFSKDNQATTRAACVVLRDSRRSYAMFGTFDPTDQRPSREYLTYCAIQKSGKANCDYDFEGSMIPGVAQYNREFNPVLEPYFLIQKYSPRMKFYINLRENHSILKNSILSIRRKT